MVTVSDKAQPAVSVDVIADTALRFEQAMNAHGFHPGDLIGDDCFHRFPVDGDTEIQASGFYRLFTRPPISGVFGSWRPDGDRGRTFHHWSYDNIEELDPDAKAAYQRRLQIARQQLQQQTEAKHQQGKTRAEALWQAAVEPDTHPYLIAKQLQGAHGCKVLKPEADNVLLVPMADSSGALQTIIRIYPDGSKKLLGGAPRQGAFHRIGELSTPAYIAEGFATAASIFEATGKCAIAAGDCGNLQPVAEALQQQHPTIDFIIAADNDRKTAGNPGLTAAKQAAEAIKARYVAPDFEGIDGATPDATDFNDLARLAGNATVAKQLQQPTESDGYVIRQLMKLGNPLEFERQLSAKAEQLGVTKAVLKEAIKAERSRTESGVISGHKLSVELRDAMLNPPTPWPDAVNGAALLDAMAEALRRYVYLPAESDKALALWALHTYLVDWLTLTPYLVIKSPVKQCGKSRLLEVLMSLCIRTIPTASLSAASLMRLINAQCPTLFMDEVDQATAAQEKSELNAIINGGYTRAFAFSMRAEAVGDTFEAKHFITFCPKALAGIGGLHDTVESRSLIIQLERKPKDAVIDPFPVEALPTVHLELKRQAVRWAQDVGLQFRQTAATVPDWLNDRQQDCWRVLAKVAALVGGHWPATLNAAIERLCGTDDAVEGLSLPELLLFDIRALFECKANDPQDFHPDKLWTDKELLPYLHSLEHRPWPEYGKTGKPITAQRLGYTLKRFKQPDGATIKTKDVRKDGDKAKGYERATFEKAFSAYLPVLKLSPTDKIEHNPAAVDNSHTLSDDPGAHPFPKVGDNAKVGDNPHGARAVAVAQLSPSCEVGDKPAAPTGENVAQLQSGRQVGDIQKPHGARAVAGLSPSRPLSPTLQERSKGSVQCDLFGNPELATNSAETSGKVSLVDKEPEDIAASLLATYGATVVYVTDNAAAGTAFAALAACEPPLGFDIETAPLPDFRTDRQAGLDPYRSRIRLVQAYNGTDTVFVFDNDQIDSRLLEPLWNRVLVAHNADFEARFLLHHGAAGLRLDCSLLLGRALLGQRQSLAELVNTVLGIELDKTLQQSDWNTPKLSQRQLNYAALDALLARLLYDKLKPRLQQCGQWRAYQLYRRVLLPVARQELAGCPFDADAHGRLIEQLQAQRDQAAAAVKRLVGADINLNSGRQLSAWLETRLDKAELAGWPRTRQGALKLDKDTLALYADLAIVKPLLDYKRHTKLLNTYGADYRQHISPVTGRLHPAFLIAGTRLGKFACSRPNVMQLPRTAEFRQLIKADADRVIVCADYSQIELRIAAELSQDKALLDAYRQGEDVHKRTAATVSGIAVEAVTKEQRQAAKAMAFGLLYGMGAKGFQTYAKASYGVAMTLEAATAAREAFFTAYPGIRRWQLETNAAAEQQQRVYSRLGRVRDFRQESGRYKMTEALSTAVASSAADVLLCALVLLEERLQGIDAQLIIHVHDEIVLDIAAGDAQAAKAQLTATMLDAWRKVFPDAPTKCLVEANQGASWADAK